MYALLAYLFVAVVWIWFAVAQARAHNSGKALRRVAAPMLAMCLMTVVGDNIMIGSGLFSYAPDSLIGVRIGLMPIEDLSYPIIAVMIAAIIGGPVARKR